MQVDIALRPAKESDYPRIACLNEEMNRLHYESVPSLVKPGYPYEFTLSAFQRILDNPMRRAFVATFEGTLCGYALLRLVDAQPDHHAWVLPKSVHIDEFITAVGFRNYGVGKRLMYDVERWAREQAAEKITLNVFAFNETARHFYERTGFGNVKIEMEKSLY